MITYNFPMEVNIKEPYKRVIQQERDELYMEMEVYMKVNLWMVMPKDMVSWLLMIMQDMKEIGIKENITVKVFILDRIGQNILGTL